MRYRSQVAIFIAIVTVNALANAAPRGKLEVPSDGGSFSGIVSFSGWACGAKKLEILVDGAFYLIPPWGSQRLDTAEVCGQVTTGFSHLFNMSNLGTGEHLAVLFADGEELDRSTFKVTRLSTGEFAEGLSACSVIDEFPTQGDKVQVSWNEATQNFEITSQLTSPVGANLNGQWSNNLSDLNIWMTPMGDGCGDKNSFHVTGYIGVNRGEVAQTMHLSGEGVVEDFRVESLHGDSANRVLDFQLKPDGRLAMTVEHCSPNKNCKKTVEGSTYFFTKEAHPAVAP